MATGRASGSGGVTAAVAPATARPRARRSKASQGKASWSFLGCSAGVWLYAVLLFAPLYYLVISAFKTNNEVFASPFQPGFTVGFDHYTDVFERLEMGTALLNSAYITVGALVLTLVLAIPASYGLARSTGRVAMAFERLYAIGLLLPGFAALVPTLLLAIEIQAFQTREFMIFYLPAAAQPLTVILLTQFMRTVPDSLFESAVIDGAGLFGVLRHVYLPLAVPGIATVTILNFILFWNEYLFALVLVGPNPIIRTVQVALPTLNTNQGITDYSIIAAATVISVTPVFVVYALLNRRMEDALVTGAVKG